MAVGLARSKHWDTTSHWWHSHERGVCVKEIGTSGLQLQGTELCQQLVSLRKKLSPIEMSP